VLDVTAEDGTQRSYEIVVRRSSALFASTAVSASSSTVFHSLAVDSGGSAAVGYQSSNTNVNYSATVSTGGYYAFGTNAVIVRFDASGNPLWAISTSGGADKSEFRAVAPDGSGNWYAVGYQYRDYSYNYGEDASGTDVTARGDASYFNPVIVKYDSQGRPVWARTLSGRTGSAQYYAVAVDASGNVYAAGDLSGAELTGFGNGVEISTAGGIIVMYNSDGDAQWVYSPETGADKVNFENISVDSSNALIVSATQINNTPVNYGNGVSASISSIYSSSGSGNGVVLKLSTSISTATAQWLVAPQSTATTSRFSGISVDENDMIYAAGTFRDQIDLMYPDNREVTGTTTNNPLLLSIASDGTVQWAISTLGGSADGEFSAVAARGGTVIASHIQTGPGMVIYADGIESRSLLNGTSDNSSAVLSYDTGGNALWAQSPGEYADEIWFNDIAISNIGNEFLLAGSQAGSASVLYGSGVQAFGAYSGSNSVLAGFAIPE
jgi:hypothetical protein